MLTLYSYFRSSTSTRLRAALNLKGLGYDYVAVNLLAGEQRSADYLARNPSGLVPALALDDGTMLSQSLAIMDWLDETHPEPPLLPPEPLARARVRALGQIIALDIHPLGNVRVLRYLGAQFGADDEAKAAWFRHWAALAHEALEARLAGAAETGTYCHGERPGYADCCLYAQMFNNRRFGLDMAPYPTVMRIFGALDALPAFRDAAPDRQPDAV